MGSNWEYLFQNVWYVSIRGGLQLVHFSPRHSSTMLWRCVLSIALNKWIYSLVDGYGLVNVLIIWITQTHMWISMPHICLSNQNNQDEHLAENTTRRQDCNLRTTLQDCVDHKRRFAELSCVINLTGRPHWGKHRGKGSIWRNPSNLLHFYELRRHIGNCAGLETRPPPFLYVISLLYNWPSLFFSK